MPSTADPSAVELSPTVQRRRGRGGSWAGWLLRRLGQGVLVVMGAMIISFGLVHATGNPIEVLGGGLLSPEAIAEQSKRLGYDRPFLEQLGTYLGNALTGDFGTSIQSGTSALGEVMSGLGYTVILVGTAMTVALVVALPVAMRSALRPGARGDGSLRLGLIVLQAIPDYWLGIMLILVFAVNLGWLPSIGASSWQSVILPALSLGVPLISPFVRLLRSEFLDVMSTDFVVALRSRGLGELEILVRHGMKNALAPFATVLALQLGLLLGGTIVVEALFGWPGIGSLMVNAVQVRDLPVIQAVVVLIAACFVLLNLLVDLLLLVVDPRTRSQWS